VAAVATTNFADRLAEAVERKRSQLVVGLDPRPDLLPVELKGDAHLGRAQAADACARFCRGLVDAVAPYVVAVKPQVAFFEALGSDGIRALEDVCAYSRAAGLQVIADAKRGDIGSTARAYATAYLESPNGKPPLADAVTVNPYLGRDSLDPFLAACRRDGAGIFCVVKTSNAGGAEVQDLVLSDGRHVWHQVAELVAEWGADLVGEHGLSSVGAVIGATHPRAVGEARRLPTLRVRTSMPLRRLRCASPCR
jgi:orotidine-5'-phosphate decarboxylase